MAEKKKLKNTGGSIIVAGQIRIRPGEIFEIKEEKISEGLRRLIGKGLTEVK